MSKALRCDKCYKTFDPLKEEGYMISFRNQVVRTKEDFENNTKSNLADISPDEWLDLCPSCSRKFTGFMCDYSDNKDIPREEPDNDPSEDRLAAHLHEEAEEVNRTVNDVYNNIKDLLINLFGKKGD